MRGRGNRGRGRGQPGEFTRDTPQDKDSQYFWGFDNDDILLIAEDDFNHLRWCPVNVNKFTKYPGLYSMFKTFINSNPTKNAELLIDSGNFQPSYLIAEKVSDDADEDPVFNFRFKDKNGNIHQLEYVTLNKVSPVQKSDD